MSPQLNRVDVIDLEGFGDQKFISFPIPDDFSNMDLSSRILYVADKLKSLESEFPLEKGKLTRHTSLAKIEGNKFSYSVIYVTTLDNEY